MKPYLVIINKKSGRGYGDNIFKENVIKQLNNNYIINYELNNNLKYNDFEGVIIVGGDGTIVPIINFFYNNNIILPICHVPAGSGNGLCKSILFSLNKNFSYENAINLIHRNRVQNLDLFDVKLSYKKIVKPCFLSISWGIISDIDINTEWLRYLGELRFTLGGIYYLFKKKSYKGTLKYLEGTKWKLVTGNFVYFLASNVSHISSSTYSNPGAKLNDGLIHITYIKHDDVSRYDLFNLLLGLDNGTHMKYVRYITTKEFSLIPENGLLVIDGELNKLQNIEVAVSKKNVNIYV